MSGTNKPTIIPFAGVPSGVCQPAQLAVNSTNGDLYDCVSGAWTLAGGGGGTTPGGSATQVQYNNASAFGGISGATSDGATISVAPIAASSIVGGFPKSGICTITLTAAQVNGATSPFTLIAAQGAGTFIKVNGDITISYKKSTAFSDTASVFVIGYDAAADILWTTWTPGQFINQSASQMTVIGGTATGFPLNTQLDTVALVNKPLVLFNSGAASASGTSSTVTFIIPFEIDTIP